MGRTSHMDESKVVIQMKDIVKKFGDFTANDHINLTVHKGEVHAILGENGAGKSTMMNVLCGLYKPTSGQIFINEKEVHFNSPKDAIDIGIGMVHQHFMLIQPFTVTENIILGMEPTKGLSVDKATARKKVLELSERYGMKVDPDAKIEDISVGMQQRVEILKVLYRGAETLILDEPTASLTPQEIEGLMEIIDNLTADGKSIILITHKLKEITEVLPGIKSPTIIPLSDPNWCAIHTVLDEKHFWEIVNKLKELGAQGILVSPIEKMIL